MLGLIVFFCVLVAIAFLLAWVTGIVAHEQISIGRALLVLIAYGIVSMVVGFALGSLDLPDWMLMLIGIPVGVVVLGGMLNLVADIVFKKALIIAVIFSVVLAVIRFVLALIFVSVAGAG